MDEIEKALLDDERERLGQLVRDTWIKWAKEQPNPKPSWLVPWEELSEPDREVDRRIGEAISEDVKRNNLKEIKFYMGEIRNNVESLRKAVLLAEDNFYRLMNYFPPDDPQSIEAAKLSMEMRRALENPAGRISKCEVCECGGFKPSCSDLCPTCQSKLAWENI